MRSVAARGLARTKLVDVAAEAGVSVGLVQSYFRSKDDLLRFGIQYLHERSVERGDELEIAPPIRDLVVSLLEIFLPLDQERRDELAVWLEFIPASLHDENMRASHVRATTEIVDGVTRGLNGARRRGELRDDLDPRSEALALVATVDGLAMHQLATSALYDAETTRAALVRAVDRIFVPENHEGEAR